MNLRDTILFFLTIPIELASIFYFHFISPFIKHRSEYDVGDKDLILLPGYKAKWTFLRKIADRFSIEDYVIHTEWGYDKRKDIRSNGMILQKYILENNLRDVVLISHSKGGQIANFVASKESMQKRISTVVTIATLCDGTLYGNLNLFGLYDFSPQNIRALRQDYVAHKTINLFPRLDHLVIPDTSLIDRREGVHNYKLDVIGHTLILISNHVLEVLEKEGLLKKS